jgi:hypothetical protein
MERSETPKPPRRDALAIHLRAAATHDEAADLHEAAANLQEHHAAEMATEGTAAQVARAERLADQERQLAHDQRLGATLERQRAQEALAASRQPPAASRQPPESGLACRQVEDETMRGVIVPMTPPDHRDICAHDEVHLAANRPLARAADAVRTARSLRDSADALMSETRQGRRKSEQRSSGEDA